MRVLRIRELAAAIVLFAASGAAAQTVHVVGPVAGPGVDFTALSAATTSAADGDIVLVLPGTYLGLATATHKSLSVVGVPDANGARPQVEILMVRNTSPEMTVLVRGLASDTGIDYSVAPFYVLNCAGTVLVEDCDFDLSKGPPGLGLESTLIGDSSRVVFSRCVLKGSTGAEGTTVASPGSAAVRITNSMVTFDACTVAGGDGGDGAATPNGVLHRPAAGGAAAIVLNSGTISVRGSLVAGGAGGDGATAQNNPVCVAPADGGAGVKLGGLLRRVDSAIAGGAAGAVSACGGSATPGPDIEHAGGSVTELAAEVGLLGLSAVIEDGGSAILSARGTPGDMAIVLLALGGSGLWVNGCKGTLLPAVPFTTLPMAPFPANGKLSISFGLPPALPPGIEGVMLILQGLFVPPAGKGVLSSASGSVLVQELP